MRLEKLVGERFKEKSADCVIDSHALMLRGGYIKYVTNGIYSSYTPLKKITRKIEQIIKEEMDAVDGQEVQFPVVMPAALWQESGRYDSVGSELVRFSDRSKSPLVLGMTHEEAAVQLVREFGQSYSKYPFMVYQIQTKFRDECRARGGLIRVREFTMKDAYSFHTSDEDLKRYYGRCHAVYERIYRRVGMPKVISVASDSGMMGGKISHEFMFLTPIGEDSIVLCGSCGYTANMEIAKNIIHNAKDSDSSDFAKITENGLCGECGCKTLSVVRGVEVGNIFQLGTKYTAAMNMTYLDREGNINYPIMGCYGIGIGRLAASICEAHHDEHGPIWPMSVAPWQVHICAVHASDTSVKEYSDRLYGELQSKGVEVIYDDRAVSAGVMFSDADLLGVPLRIIISPRNMGASCCEIVSRDKKIALEIPMDLAAAKILELIKSIQEAGQV